MGMDMDVEALSRTAARVRYMQIDRGRGLGRRSTLRNLDGEGQSWPKDDIPQRVSGDGYNEARDDRPAYGCESAEYDARDQHGVSSVAARSSAYPPKSGHLPSLTA